MLLKISYFKFYFELRHFPEKLKKQYLVYKTWFLYNTREATNNRNCGKGRSVRLRAYHGKALEE